MAEPISTGAALGAAGITGGSSIIGSVISGLFGSSAQQAANDTSRAINRENNFWNLLMMDRANAFNAEQSAIERDFNSAEALKAFERSDEAYKRRYQDTVRDLRHAGLNPLLAVNGLTASGSASSSAASAGHASASALGSSGLPHISAVNPMSGFSGLGSAVNSAVDSYIRLKNLDMAKEKVDSEVKNIDADTLSKTLDALSKDPDVIKERRRYGETGLMGQVYHFVRSLADGLGFTDSFVNGSEDSNSALRGKQISEEFKEEVAPVIIKQSLESSKRGMSINDWDLHHGHGAR